MSKQVDKSVVKATLSAQPHAQGIDFAEDFHTLSNSKVELLVVAAKMCGYRKPANANGSTARYFFQHLAKQK